MSSGFEDSFAKIVRQKERAKPETRGRKKKKAPDLGDTASGRSIAGGPRRGRR